MQMTPYYGVKIRIVVHFRVLDGDSETMRRWDTWTFDLWSGICQSFPKKMDGEKRNKNSKQKKWTNYSCMVFPTYKWILPVLSDLFNRQQNVSSTNISCIDHEWYKHWISVWTLSFLSTAHSFSTHLYRGYCESAFVLGRINTMMRDRWGSAALT